MARPFFKCICLALCLALPAASLATNDVQIVEEAEAVQTNSAGATVVVVEPPPDTFRPMTPQRDGTVRYEPDYYPYVDRNCVYLFSDIDFSADSKEVALVLFVVVGTVVVVAQVLYLGQFLYEVATGTDEYDYWVETAAQGSFLAGSGRSGGLYGGKLSFGFIRDTAHVGLAVEGGYLDAEVSVEGEADEVALSGAYGMAGPSLRFDMDGEENPTLLLLEVMAGGADDENVGFMSLARLGVSWGLGRHARLGISLGGLYMDIDEEAVPLQEDSDFNLLVGADLGFRFF